MDEQEQRALSRSLGSIEAKLDMLLADRAKRDEEVNKKLEALDKKAAYHDRVIYAGSVVMALFIAFKDTILIALNLKV